MNGTHFEWDASKAQTNLKKHRISFEEAKTVFMKTQPTESKAAPEMLPEYDFSGKKGVRGKYHHTYQKGHTVKIRQEDGTVVTQYFTLEEGAVLLAPDVREYFPDSESVNQALRGLISLIPHKTARGKQQEAIQSTAS